MNLQGLTAQITQFVSEHSWQYFVLPAFLLAAIYFSVQALFKKRNVGKDSAGAFLRKKGFELRAKVGEGKLYKATIEAHDVEVVVGKAVEMSIALQTQLPEGLTVRLLKQPARSRAKLWIKNEEMDPQFFDEFAELRARNPVDLKAFMTPSRHAGMRRAFWLGRGISVSEGRLRYVRYGGLDSVERMESILKLLLRAAARIEKK